MWGLSQNLLDLSILLKQQTNTKVRSKRNTYHVMNKNIAPSEVADSVEDESGDPFRGITKAYTLESSLNITLACLGHPQA